MATDVAALRGGRAPAAREIPHTVSPGLWTLAWRRLRSDTVGMVSLVIVAAFVLMMILSGAGLIAADWNREVGVNYAPPTFLGAESGAGAPAATTLPGSAGARGGTQYKSNIVDPIGDVIQALKAGRTPGEAATTPPPAAPPSAEEPSVDPLADVMADIRKSEASKATAKPVERKATLPFGGDKWGRDVLKKTIKGSETSIFVGLAAAVLATFLGTVFGALAGYFGRWVDDAFNWFYSVFSSIPYLLLILAVAAVLQQKGVFTVILILGLTGWTGVFRLMRAEYLKHKSREYVQAADAIGASNSRRMFLHIFPNVSHVVLVQLSILVVGFIKAEVILSFLGFGVPVDVVSWGSMLNEAQNELILGKWWQLVAATAAMAILVTAFSLFTDALRDALDPKLKGRVGA
ncbi:MAG TPA: ABC transporter permease [Casimicrobiaceae bacterium]|jgi:peptide/nickel transport system permease protein|nr:ABC transporter permease [Casimicrobiaceae bacterium]